jgi:hypothetical protein
MALADSESQNNESRHSGEFGPSRKVLQQRAPPQSNHVDEGEHSDQEQTRKVSSGQGNAAQSQDDVLL